MRKIIADIGEITMVPNDTIEIINGPDDSTPVPGRMQGIPETIPRNVSRDIKKFIIFKIRNTNKLIIEIFLKFFNFKEDTVSFIIGSSTKIAILVVFQESIKIQ